MTQNWHFTRRAGLRAAALAAAAGLAGAPLKALAQPGEAALIEALRDHLRYSAGFRRKLATGFYSEIGSARSLDDGLRAFGEVKARLAALDGDNLALVHWADTTGALCAWLIDTGGIVASSVSPYRYEGLDYLTWALAVDQRMQTRVAVPRNAPAPPAPQPPARDDLLPAEALAMASAELLGPAIAAALAERSGRLLVLPARDTGGAPYGALPLANGEMLTRRHAVVIMPDIETLANTELVHRVSQIAWPSALLVGNPDLGWNPDFRFSPLPHAQAEVEEVAGLLGLAERRVLTGGAATLNAVVGNCSAHGSADLVYLASHAVTNRVNPMDGSFVGLAQANLTGQMLRGRTFEAWGARHPLVVLSACQTALGRVFDGGAYGMSRVMFAAGAAQVVSSLWNVDDAATRTLMTDFAERLFFGYTTEQALQRAQWKVAELFGDDVGAWASFCVYGMPSTRA